MLAYEKVIFTLRGLMDTNQECRRGFDSASQVFPAEVSDRLLAFSMVHFRFAEELAGIIEILGGGVPAQQNPEPDWSPAWKHLPEAIRKGNPNEVSNECLKGEEASIITYQTAIGTGLPPAILELIVEQRNLIWATRDELLSLLRQAAPIYHG